MTIAKLSAHISLEQSRKQAKDLLKAFKAGDPKVLDHIRWNHPRFKRLRDEEIKTRPFALADAQLVIAGLHSFESWPKLLQHIERLRLKDPDVMRFENAADAIVAGDIPALKKMLAEHPELIHARSTRHQHAPLLHYVTAQRHRELPPENSAECRRGGDGAAGCRR
jgi:hypothetical protein